MLGIFCSINPSILSKQGKTCPSENKTRVWGKITKFWKIKVLREQWLVSFTETAIQLRRRTAGFRDSISHICGFNATGDQRIEAPRLTKIESYHFSPRSHRSAKNLIIGIFVLIRKKSWKIFSVKSIKNINNFVRR